MNVWEKIKVVADSVMSDAILVGVYALFDMVLPQASQMLMNIAPGAGNFLTPLMGSLSFLTKEVMFHHFGATQIRQILNIQEAK